MADRLIRVLLVGANDATSRITRDVLAETPHNTFAVDAVETHAAALEAINHTPYDVCLVSNPLGTASSLGFLRQMETLNITLPALILTEPDDQAVGIDARRAGAADYVLTPHLSAPLLERAIRYAIEHRRTLDALQLAHN
ncbi:MAG: response regulator, partial [Candidatus Tectomicrobia bacterium]|nr:response regulator [Candidatus Tectomicrobia bacterium]